MKKFCLDIQKKDSKMKKFCLDIPKKDSKMKKFYLDIPKNNKKSSICLQIISYYGDMYCDFLLEDREQYFYFSLQDGTIVCNMDDFNPNV